MYPTVRTQWTTPLGEKTKFDGVVDLSVRVYSGVRIYRNFKNICEIKHNDYQFNF